MHLVRLWHEADIRHIPSNVGCRGLSGHGEFMSTWPSLPSPSVIQLVGTVGSGPYCIAKVMPKGHNLAAASCEESLLK
jgi:hypothetical protein